MLNGQNAGLDHKSSSTYLRQALLSMPGYTEGSRERVFYIPPGRFCVVFFDGSSLCDLPPSPGSSDTLIKSDLPKCKTGEETGMYFKKTYRHKHDTNEARHED